MNVLLRLLLCSAFACSVLLASCLGGQTGQEDRNPTAVECALERSALQPDAATELGFTAAELEAVLAVEQAASLTWLRMGTSTQLTLEVQEVQSRALNSNGNPGCPDTVELGVLVLIATEDGLLHEELMAKVVAQSLNEWSLGAQVSLGALAGELDPAQLQLDLDNWQAPRLSFSLRGFESAPGALTGQIFLDGEDPTPNDNSAPTSAAIAELSAP